MSNKYVKLSEIDSEKNVNSTSPFRTLCKCDIFMMLHHYEKDKLQSALYNKVCIYNNDDHHLIKDDSSCFFHMIYVLAMPLEQACHYQ